MSVSNSVLCFGILLNADSVVDGELPQASGPKEPEKYEPWNFHEEPAHKREWEEYWSAMSRVDDKPSLADVTLVQYAGGKKPKYLLAITASVRAVGQRKPMALGSEVETDPSWAQRLREICTVRGVEVTDQPQWWICNLITR